MDGNPVVCLLEDEPPLREIFELWINREGPYEVRSAQSGAEALECIDEDVDVGLFDRRLSDGSGDEVLREVRDRGYEFPVAMVSGANPEWELLDQSWAEYVLKPISSDELVGTTQYLVRLSEADSEVREAFATARKKLVAEDLLFLGRDKTGRYDRLKRRFNTLETTGGATFSAAEWEAICTERSLTDD